MTRPNQTPAAKLNGGRTMCKIFGKPAPVSDPRENTAITNAATFSRIGVNIFRFAGEQIEIHHRLKKKVPAAAGERRPAGGGATASIAGMYIPHPLQGQCPCPPCRQGRKGAATDRRKERA